MKKILVFLFLLSGSPLFGQVVVTYDFLRDSIHYYKKNPSFGETVQFKVVNINTFRYNTKVSGKEVDFNTDSDLFFKKLDLLSLPKAESGAGTEDGTKGIMTSETIAFIKTIKAFENSVTNLEESKDLYNNLSVLLEMDGQSFKAIDKAKQNLVDKFLRTIKTENPAEQMILLKKEVLQKLEAVKNAFKAVENEFKKIPVFYCKYDYYSCKMSEAARLNAAVNEEYIKLTDELMVLYQKFSEKNFTCSSIPIVARTDEINFNVEIVPKAGKEKALNIDTIKFEIPLTVKGGLKIDFSTGVIFSFINSSFDQTYRLEQNTADTNLVTIRENSNRNLFIPSVGAFMHFYPRCTGTAKFGGVLGLSTNDLNSLRYHLGISVILGSKNRVIISTGATGNYAKALASEYEVDQVITKDLGLKEVPVEDVFRLGAFVAFSYNLTKGK
jgi:hypothetical protein